MHALFINSGCVILTKVAVFVRIGNRIYHSSARKFVRLAAVCAPAISAGVRSLAHVSKGIDRYWCDCRSTAAAAGIAVARTDRRSHAG
jgi:hypothetical protein